MHIAELCMVMCVNCYIEPLVRSIFPAAGNIVTPGATGAALQLQGTYTCVCMHNYVVHYMHNIAIGIHIEEYRYSG